jgi:hypothetical protein
MKNYWLSEYSKNGSDDDSDETNGDDHSHDNKDPKGKLNERQSLMYDNYEQIVEEYGAFNKTSKANGAHYASAKENPFKAKGLVCSNCVFFMGGQACEIVSGTIEAQGICKLWIIPQDLVKE